MIAKNNTSAGRETVQVLIAFFYTLLQNVLDSYLLRQINPNGIGARTNNGRPISGKEQHLSPLPFTLHIFSILTQMAFRAEVKMARLHYLSRDEKRIFSCRKEARNNKHCWK